MPKVPEEQTALYSTNVPGVQFPYRQEFGKIGQSLERLGGNVEQASVNASDIYNEVQRQQAISQAQNTATKATVDHDAYLRDLKTASPDGFIHENGDQQQPIVQNQDNTPRTITQEYQDWANKRYMADQDNLTPMAAAMYRQKMLPEVGARMVQLNNEAHTMALASTTAQQKDSNDTNFKEFNIAPWDKTDGSVQNRPDLTKFSDYLQTANLNLQQRGGVLDPATGQLKGGLMNQQQIDALRIKQSNDYGEKWFDSALTKVKEEKSTNGPHLLQDIQNLLDIVDGKDPQSQAFQKVDKVTPNSALSPEQQEKIKDQLLREIPGAKATDMSEFNLYEKSYISASEQGKYKPDQANPSRDNLMNWGETFLKNGDWSNADFIQHMSNWTAAEVRGALGGRNFENMSTAQQHALADKTIATSMKSMQQNAQMRGLGWTDDIGSQIQHETSAQVFAKITQIDSEKKSDFPGFISQWDNRGQPRSGTLYRAAQLDWTNPQGLLKSGQIPGMLHQLSNVYAANYGANMDYWRPITKDQSASLGASLAAMSPAQQGQAIDALKQAFGKAYPNLMDTLIQDNSLKSQNSASADWKFVGAIPDIQGRVAQLSAIQGRGATKELYEASTGKKWDDLQSKVSAAWKDNIGLIVKSNPLNIDTRTYANSILNTATSAVAQTILQTGDTDIDHAIESSKAEAFKGYPTVDKVGNHMSLFGWKTPFSSGPQVNVAFPANISEDQKNVIKQNLANLMTEDGLKKAGIAPPKAAPGQPDFSDHFHKMASENISAINLVNTKDGPAYTIDYTGRDGNGKSNDVVNHMMDSKGNIKYFPLEDLMVPRNATTAPQPVKPLKQYQPRPGQY